ncbi:MAG TPA: MFS transporter, partial [Stellaceae bacterium]|nr:MFS transporter [Stellaceae bacterium]
MSKAEPKGAWLRLVVALAISTIGGSGFWSVVVALPAVATAFSVTRADASLAYAATMGGYACGVVVMGRLADRFGIALPLAAGTLALGLGDIAVGNAPSLSGFALAQGLLVGVGSAAAYTPLVANISLWFTRRRGVAIAICASGNTLAGAIWPSVLQHFFGTLGWRHTFVALGLFCLATMLPLIPVLRRRPPAQPSGPAAAVP